MVLAGWAIWITIDLAQKDETTKDLKEIIKYTLKQNIKLDSQIRAQNAQIAMLAQVSERSLLIANETSLINKGVKNQSELYNMSTVPNIIPTSNFELISKGEPERLHDFYMALHLQNEGLRHAKDVVIHAELYTIDSLRKEQIYVSDKDHLPEFPSKATHKWFNHFFIEPKMVINKVKICISYADPASLKQMKKNLYYLTGYGPAEQVVNKKNIEAVEKGFRLLEHQKRPFYNYNPNQN